MPTSAIASTAILLSSPAGSDPPDQAMALSPARWANHPSAIWERPALCVHRNSTVGMVLRALSSRSASASRRSLANFSAKETSHFVTVALAAIRV